MTARIPAPATLWHRDYDEVLRDSFGGALDVLVRRLLVQVDDITIGEVDRITARATVAGKDAILDAIAAGSDR